MAGDGQRQHHEQEGHRDNVKNLFGKEVFHRCLEGAAVGGAGGVGGVYWQATDVHATGLERERQRERETERERF
jgi:hypothetical protein